MHLDGSATHTKNISHVRIAKATCRSDAANEIRISSTASIESQHNLRRGGLDSQPGSKRTLDEEGQRFADLYLAAYEKEMAYSKSDSHFDDRMQTICEIPEVEDSLLAMEEGGSSVAYERLCYPPQWPHSGNNGKVVSKAELAAGNRDSTSHIVHTIWFPRRDY